MKLRLSWLLGLVLCSTSLLVAQRQVQGTISAAAEPLIGATVQVKGASQGTVTDIEGFFELTLPANHDILIVSYTGYETKEVKVGPESRLELTLSESSVALGEVVVTALGVQREKKALGYAVQDIAADELVEARSTNVVNGLSGRVAGLQIVSGSVPGGGSQVTIRGNGSILGNNQPLYVIDGVPMEGDFAPPLAGATDNNVYGGGISEISPDNIESITVLKGANAAALYGSRAANGVILVTTKSGKGAGSGFKLEYNGNFTVDQPFVVPQFQNIYGGGNGGVTWYADGRNGGITDPVAIEQFRAVYPKAPLVGTAGVDESWGAPMDGRLVRHWWSGTEVAPLVPVPDSWSNFWEMGTTLTNNVAISNNYGTGYFRFSFGTLGQQGIYYNNDYHRSNYRLNVNHQLAEKLSVKVSTEYVRSGSDNRQQPYLWDLQTWHHRHDDWGLLKEYERFMDVHITRPGDSYPYANWQHSFAANPFYLQTHLTNANDKDRFLGSVALTYEFTPALSLLVRSGTDLWTDTRRAVTRFEQTKSGASRTQAFEEDILRRQETNTDFIFTFSKYVTEAFSVNAQFGGVHRTNYYKRNYTGVNDAVVNGLYNVANSASISTNRSRIEEKTVNSLFGALSLGYGGWLYLDVTGRNDWSSTLPAENNSYFYPSFSLSTVVSDLLGIQSKWLSYAKVRASWAQVGSDTDPYRLRQIFEYSAPWNASTPTFYESTNIANSDLRPERTTGIELGADLRFLRGRLGLDFSLYEQTTTDQIIPISVSRATGYASKLINAGEVVNRGFEIVLNGALLQGKDLSWNMGLNYTRNRNEVISLYTDDSGNRLETIVLTARRGLSLEARVGEPYGTLFGSAYARVPEGPYAGQIIFNNGIPQVNPQLQIIGNVSPDWLGGITTDLTYKGISLGALIDAKVGGDISDESSSTGMQTGIYPITALGREEGVIGLGVKNIGTAENPEYVPNDVVADTKSVTRMLSVRSVNEGAVFEASYIKLRELRLSYSLPPSLLSRIRFVSQAQLSLVGRNVAMLYSTHSQIDPELNLLGGNLQGGLNYVTLPSTRSLGFNLNLVF